jgi:hypothetical protein
LFLGTPLAADPDSIACANMHVFRAVAVISHQVAAVLDALALALCYAFREVSLADRQVTARLPADRVDPSEGIALKTHALVIRRRPLSLC